MNNFPKITVITPVKNAVNTIEKTIKTLLSQNYPNLEYIVIDGASTDGTLDIINKYRDKISYFETSDDRSNILAFKKGVEKSSGEIVAMLNADDFYEDGVLSSVAKAFSENADLDMVSFRCRVLKKDGEEYKIIEEPSVKDVELSDLVIPKIFAINARFFKRDLFKKNGLLIQSKGDGKDFVSSDIEYLMRCLFNGLRNKTLDQVGYNYLSHNGSITFGKSVDRRIDFYDDRVFIAKRFLESDEFKIPVLWKKTMKKWLVKYRCLCAAESFYLKNFDKMFFYLKDGIKDVGAFKFIFYFLKTLVRGRKKKEVGF